MNIFEMPAPQISIARDFSEFPAGRESSDGPNSGERFRSEFLLPALSDNEGIITVDLDGTMGFGSSFLEEAFGGLVRTQRLTYDDLRKRIKIIDSREIYEQMVWRYIKDESKRLFGD